MRKPTHPIKKALVRASRDYAADHMAADRLPRMGSQGLEERKARAQRAGSAAAEPRTLDGDFDADSTYP